MKNFSRAVVTGGAGFIGSHIVDALIQRGIETIVLDDFSTGTMDNLSQHHSNPLLKVYSGNVKKIGRLLKNVKDIDVVFHEAAIASVTKSVSDPISVHDVNVNAALQVLNFCVEKVVSKLIFASSAAVYGVLNESSASEDMHCSPYSPYGASKMSVENYLSAYHYTYGLDTIALRYFNAYGPRQKMNDYSGVITVFVNQLLQNITPTIFGDGSQTRDFVHVKDLVRANIIAMEASSVGGQAFNVASGEAISVLDLFQTLRDIIGAHTISPIFAEPRKGDVKSGLASIEKIRKQLAYEPSVSLREGLKDTVRYMKNLEQTVLV